MRINTTVKYDFDDILIEPKWSESPSRNIPVLRTYRFKYSPHDYIGCPLISSNMDTTGTLCMADSLNKLQCSVALHKFYDPKEVTGYLKHNWFTIGIKEVDEIRLNRLLVSPKYICIDVANGYTQSFVSFVRKIRDSFPEAVIMAGNVATPEMTQALILNGRADIVKVGIGPGSVCTTRLITGVGYPQASAIAECADIAHGLKAHICADGGCKNPGDVAKAFGLGADFVMIGGLLAGTDECDGEWLYDRVDISEFRTTPGGTDKYVYGNKISLKFHGMSSEEAHELHYGQMQDYKTAEGVEITVPYKGPADAVIRKIMGGIRSACAYVGASTFKNFSKCCTFNVVHRPKEYLFPGIKP